MQSQPSLSKQGHLDISKEGMKFCVLTLCCYSVSSKAIGTGLSPGGHCIRLEQA